MDILQAWIVIAAQFVGAHLDDPGAQILAGLTVVMIAGMVAAKAP